MKTRLGHYDIVAELGRGGMGVVYKGYEASLNRYVAIKVLADSLAHDPAVKERFLREARSMAALNDPHIIQIYFIGEDEGQTFFVMEFVEGESLGSMLKRDHQLTVEQSAKVIQQTALGLSTAHDRGVVHRDIKPGNLMITSRGAVKIADFGIALSNQDLSKKLTSTGEFVGTPGYLSPEVCLGKPVDQRSDIFSLGIVLFEMLTGKMPFNDDSPLGLMLEVVKAEIPDVRSLNHDADPQIAAILAKMIAKDPNDRYQNCHDLVADLNQHPLVAKGGPITVQTKLSAAAATMIGQKTPVSGQISAADAAHADVRARRGEYARHHERTSDAAARRWRRRASVRARSPDGCTRSGVEALAAAVGDRRGRAARGRGRRLRDARPRARAREPVRPTRRADDGCRHECDAERAGRCASGEHGRANADHRRGESSHGRERDDRRCQRAFDDDTHTAVE
jgi:serine/threonine-protein kinase